MSLLDRILMIGRAAVVALVGLGLYFNWFAIDLEALANTVTVLTGFVAVWALFDRDLLTWIVRKLKLAWDRVSKRRSETSPEGEAATVADQAADVPAIEEDEATTVRKPYGGCLTAAFAAILVIVFVAIANFSPLVWSLFGDLFSRNETPPAAEMPAEADEPAPAPPEPTPEPKTIQLRVRPGDTCSQLALLCSGSWRNYLLLPGDPTCRIDGGDNARPGQILEVPGSWSLCPDRVVVVAP